MFNDKVILITGASSGLGRELAINLSQLNAKLGLMARRQDELEKTKSLCLTRDKFLNPSILLIQGDVTQASDCAAAVNQTINQFGQLDYLILNAGVSMWSRFDAVQDIELFRRLIEVNYLGAVQPIFYALPHLKKTNGMIVAISSTQGKIAIPYHTGYSASKHALEGFLDALRLEECQINILTVAPGWIEGTNLKNNAYKNGEKTRHSASKREVLTAQSCAKSIVNAIKNRENNLVLPTKYRLLPFIKLLSPALLNWLIQRRM